MRSRRFREEPDPHIATPVAGTGFCPLRDVGHGIPSPKRSSSKPQSNASLVHSAGEQSRSSKRIVAF